MPVDSNGFADPYLKVMLGPTTRVDDAVDKALNQKTLNPEFCRRYDFETKLPGPSLLTLQVWDANDYTWDKFLGQFFFGKVRTL